MSDEDSLSSTSTSDVKGDNSHDADDDVDDPGVTIAKEHFEDAQGVLDPYEPTKRDHSSGSSSSEGKCGKVIGAQLLNMAMAVPIPSDDDETQDPTWTTQQSLLLLTNCIAQPRTLILQIIPLLNQPRNLNLNYLTHSWPHLALRCFYPSRKLAHGLFSVLITGGGGGGASNLKFFFSIMAQSVEIITVRDFVLLHRSTLFSWLSCIHVDFFVYKRPIWCLKLNFMLGYKKPMMGVFLAPYVIIVSHCHELLVVVAWRSYIILTMQCPPVSPTNKVISYLLLFL